MAVQSPARRDSLSTLYKINPPPSMAAGVGAPTSSLHDPLDVSTFTSADLPSAAAPKPPSRYLANSKSSSNLYLTQPVVGASSHLNSFGTGATSVVLPGSSSGQPYASVSGGPQDFASLVPVSSSRASQQGSSRQHKTLSMHGGMPSFAGSVAAAAAPVSGLPAAVIPASSQVGSRRPHALMSSASTSGGLDWWAQPGGGAGAAGPVIPPSSVTATGNGILPSAAVPGVGRGGVGGSGSMGIWAQPPINPAISVSAMNSTGMLFSQLSRPGPPHSSTDRTQSEQKNAIPNRSYRVRHQRRRRRKMNCALTAEL